MVMRRNDPLGYSGTMAAMASAPNCGQLRPAGSDQPLQLLLAGRAVTPGFNFAPAACPTGDRGPALDRAVQLDDGLYAAGADHECFLPNSGGGHCRAVDR